MDREILEKELQSIQERHIELESELKQCKKVRDDVLKKKLEKEDRELGRRAKVIQFKLGRYKFPEDEMVEYEEGKFMRVNEYWWLIDL